MKRFAFVLCLAFAVPSVARAEGGGNLQAVTVVELREDPLVIIDGGGWYVFGRKAEDPVDVRHGDFGMSWYFHLTEGWSEIHAGPTWSPNSHLTFGADVGVESEADDTFRFRYALSLTAKTGPWLFIGSVEHNTGLFSGDNGGLWYDLNGLISDPRYKPWVFGFKWRSDIGVGPYAEVTLPGGNFKLWAAWTKLDPEHLENGAHWSRWMLGTVAQF